MADDPTQPAPSDLAALIARTLHNEGDGGIWEHFDRRNAEIVARMLAQVIADTYLPAVVREAEARALREAADDFDRNPMPSFRAVRDRVARVLRDRADRLDPDAARGERGAGR